MSSNPPAISAIVATRDRPESFARLLKSLTEAATLPAEVVIVDASTDPSATRLVARDWERELNGASTVKWHRADVPGAASQRNQGVASATQPFIWFIDDDILLRTDCAGILAATLEADRALGGVNAMIENQHYKTPGTASRLMFTLLNGATEKSFAGKVIGPAVNLLPEDRDQLPEVAPVEWLNTTCTMYRREALPDPPFDNFFEGYSLMEDLALSLRVAQRGWKLANVRAARIFHDSQPGAHKSDVSARARMEVVNRYYVMTKVIGKRRMLDQTKLVLFEIFNLASLLGSKGSVKALLPTLGGKLRAARDLFGPFNSSQT